MSDDEFDIASLKFKRFDQSYRHHRVKGGGYHAFALNSPLSQEHQRLSEWYYSLKEQRLPALDKELKDREKQLVDLKIGSVERRLVGGENVQGEEYETWAKFKQTALLNSLTESVLEKAETEADRINTEWQLSIENEVAELKRKKRELEIEVDAARDWAALQKKKFE